MLCLCPSTTDAPTTPRKTFFDMVTCLFDEWSVSDWTTILDYKEYLTSCMSDVVFRDEYDHVRRRLFDPEFRGDRICTLEYDEATADASSLARLKRQMIVSYLATHAPSATPMVAKFAFDLKLTFRTDARAAGTADGRPRTSDLHECFFEFCEEWISKVRRSIRTVTFLFAKKEEEENEGAVGGVVPAVPPKPCTVEEVKKLGFFPEVMLNVIEAEYDEVDGSSIRIELDPSVGFGVRHVYEVALSYVELMLNAKVVGEEQHCLVLVGMNEKEEKDAWHELSYIYHSRIRSK